MLIPVHKLALCMGEGETDGGEEGDEGGFLGNEGIVEREPTDQQKVSL